MKMRNYAGNNDEIQFSNEPKNGKNHHLVGNMVNLSYMEGKINYLD